MFSELSTRNSTNCLHKTNNPSKSIKYQASKIFNNPKLAKTSEIFRKTKVPLQATRLLRTLNKIIRLLKLKFRLLRTKD